MNVYERQARALESIARELKGIGKTLGQIKEIFSPEIQLIDESLLRGFAVGENDQEVDDVDGGFAYFDESLLDEDERTEGGGNG